MKLSHSNIDEAWISTTTTPWGYVPCVKITLYNYPENKEILKARVIEVPKKIKTRYDGVLPVKYFNILCDLPHIQKIRVPEGVQIVDSNGYYGIIEWY
ncbi:MAG: hypothetical protein KBS40_02610 [Bacteroidales bacterium]|nr:hypothetical protein [Bacteroidales bacterium]